MSFFGKLKSLFQEQQLDNRDIINSLLSFIVNDESLAIPRYCPQVNSEEYASQNQKKLPLVYVWNENLEAGTFTVSINGLIVGHLLEGACSRDNPNFAPIRDEIMVALSKTATNLITEMCARSGLPVSEVLKCV